MCDCKDRVHPEIDCSSEECHCHPPDTDSEFVYVSVSFPQVTREAAVKIVRAAEEAAGLVSYNVFYDDSPVGTEDEDDVDG